MFEKVLNLINQKPKEVIKTKSLSEIYIEDTINKVENKFAECLKMPEVVEALSILDKLIEKYGKELPFHKKEHTLDVMKEVILFATLDHASDEVLRQQVIAAAWHDTGFVIEKSENEVDAVELFKQSETYKKILNKEKGSLSEEEANEIINNIWDTKIFFNNGYPEQMHEHKSKYFYLLDADLSNFGRDDFFIMNKKVAEELGKDLNDIDVKIAYYKSTIDFLKHHEYKTDSAKSLRNAKKQENLERLEEEYEALLKLKNEITEV